MADSGQSSITVAVRVRPFTIREAASLQRNDDGTIFLGDGSFASAPTPKLHRGGIRNVIKVMDDRCLIFDPPEESPVQKFSRTVVPGSKKVKDQVFAFDRVFDDNTTQAEVYEGTTRGLLDSVLDGYNATVFAYGATGCGKTHTITGTAQHPGIIFLTMQELFEKIEERSHEKSTELTLSYLEIYNETIRDLLVPGGSKSGLPLREDSNAAVAVPGLTSHRPRDVQEVMDMIVQGNEYRTVSPTEANATSSRSHAVLQINIAQKDRNADVNEPHTMATLSIIDLAGSERASVTKNRGERLTEGANINKSLLALGGCINALCDPRGKAHVPYRNSKLTRLLKFSLGGNCKTVMIVCVSPSSAHYDETQNTLRYANRAKNIQTKVTRNVFNVNRHVKDFLIKIDEQMALINELRAQQRESEKTSFAKFRKQYEKRDGIAREAMQRLRAAYDNAGAERQERITSMRKLKHFERRISLLSAWIAAFDAVAEQRENDAEMPQSLAAIRKTAQGIMLELENSRHHIHQRLDKSAWERHLDTALAHGVRQLELAEGADTGEIESLTREAELLKSEFNREAYREVLEQEKAGDAAMMQMLLTAQFEIISSLSGIMMMDEDSAVSHAKEAISRLLQTGLTAASQVVKPDGSLAAMPDALPLPRRTLRKRKSLSAYRPVVPPAVVAVQNEHVFATPMKALPRRRKALGMPKKGVSFTPVKRTTKSRGVRWRDDETEDGTLEDFEKTPQNLFSSPSVQPSPVAKSKIPSPPQLNSVPKDDAASNDDSSISLEMSDAPSLPIAKTGRFQAGFLSRGARFSSVGSGLPVSSSPPTLSMHLRSSSSPDVARTPPLRTSLDGPRAENSSPLSLSKVPRPSPPQYNQLQSVMDENNPPNGSGSDSESGTIDMQKLRNAIASKKPRRMSLVGQTSVPVARRVNSIAPPSIERPPSRSTMPMMGSAGNGISRLRRGSLERRKSPPLLFSAPDSEDHLTTGQARRMNMGSNLRLENLGAAQRDGMGLEGPHRVTIKVGPGSAAAGVSAHRRLDSRGVDCVLLRQHSASAFALIHQPSTSYKLCGYNNSDIRTSVIRPPASFYTLKKNKITGRIIFLLSAVHPQRRIGQSRRTSSIKIASPLFSPMDMDHGSGSQQPVRYIRSRIANACDGCKARKVKCDGKLPCGFCVARQRAQVCHYSPQRRRRQSQKLPRSPPPSVRESRDRDRDRDRDTRDASSSVRSASPSRTPASRRVSSVAGVGVSSASASASASASVASPAMGSERRHRLQSSASALNQAQESSVAEDETEVPRDARLLCDAHGKLTFIGDCAPLSFFQSVRRLVTNRVGQNAFAPQTSRFSVLENAPARQSKRSVRDPRMPEVRPVDVTPAVSAYLSTTASLVDLFDSSKLLDDLTIWANLTHKPDNVTTIIHFLVLAIGLQAEDDVLSQQYFEYARDLAYTDLSDSLGVETVQAFILVTVYMLCSCQINGAFLFFGIAARAAYSIGLHRTEVNARFGHEIHQQRDQLWKSLRVLDLFLSSSMGRPPATSDVDCTVPYHAQGADGKEVFDLLNASVQILLILENIILEVYGRKKISMQLTEGISIKLRGWSGKWLGLLKEVIAQPAARNEAQVTGACQVLSSYYYAVMLVSRPFLMYELFQRLVDGSAASSRPAMASGRSKLADACIDAASLMVDPVLDLIERGVLKRKAPLLVSWLFAASLVLGVGLLGGFGRILEKYTRMSIQTMDHFAQNDAHARQYSLIAQSLLTTALEHLERQDLQERMRRTENSSQLFGLVAPDARSPLNKSPAPLRDIDLRVSTPDTTMTRSRSSMDRSLLQHQSLPSGPSPRLGEMDSVFLGLSESMLHTPDTTYWDGIVGNDNDPNSALNLFPLLEAGGGIDLAHWL